MPGWIQCPETGKLIPREQYVRPKETTHHIMEDIKPFVSPITREVISTRPQLERHNKQHGVTNSADYSPEFKMKVRATREREQARADRQDRINKIVQQLER